MKQMSMLHRGIILVTLVLAGTFVWRWSTHTVQEFGTKVALPTRRIAILTPTTHASLEQIEQAFRTTLAQSTQMQYDHTVFNANGDPVLMRAQAEEAVQGKFDLVFAIATQPAQLAREFIAKKQLPLHFVFAAVNNPVKSGIVDSLEQPGPYGTGAVEVEDYARQLTLLQEFCPDAKKIMLVYNPSQGSGLGAHKEKIEALCQPRGLTVVPVEVYQVHEIYTRARARIADVDVVMVLKDNLVVSALDVLVKLCNAYQVTLLASDLDSCARGAALCFGVAEAEYGRQAAAMARNILEQGMSPAAIPCVVVDSFEMRVNNEAAAMQRRSASRDDKKYSVAALTHGGEK